MASPFRHESPLPPEELCDREQEQKDLAELCIGGRFVKLLAPRRYGKTSLLKATFAQLEEEKRAICLLCDLDGVVSRIELAERLHIAYADQLGGKAFRAAWDFLSAAGISLKLGGFGVETKLATTGGPNQLIETLIDTPLRIAERTKKPVAVAFDEFQVVLALDNVDGLLRSRIQHQAPNVSYIFCGSEPSMMERLFDDRARPLYGQALPMRIGRLSRSALGEYIVDRFELTGRDPGRVLDPLLDVAEGHPQRAMLLAHALWIATPKNAEADESTLACAIDYADLEVTRECEALWGSLDLGEKRTLRAFAQSNTAISKATREALDLPLQTLDAARKRLIGKGLLEKNDNHEYRSIDPLFERWINRSPQSVKPALTTIN